MFFAFNPSSSVLILKAKLSHASLHFQIVAEQIELCAWMCQSRIQKISNNNVNDNKYHKMVFSVWISKDLHRFALEQCYGLRRCATAKWKMEKRNKLKRNAASTDKRAYVWNIEKLWLFKRRTFFFLSFVRMLLPSIWSKRHSILMD